MADSIRLESLFEIKSILDIVGNRNAITAMRSFSLSVEKGEHRKPLLLYGPSGVGKTASALAIALENNWNIVNFNASDYRDSDTIKNILIPASNTKSIFGKRNLIILDEIDDLVARFDSGAPAAISELVKKSKNPIIFISNDLWDRKIIFLRNVVEPIEFKKIDIDSMTERLAHIVKREDIQMKMDTIKVIAARAKGDMRSAINDLYAFIGSDDAIDDISEQLGMRDRKSDVFSVLDRIFLSNTLSSPIAAMANSDVDADMLYGWIDENIPKRYKGAKELSLAFRNLSSATIYSSRAVRMQYYGLWRYRNVLMSSGISLSKTGYPSTLERYAFPRVISSLSKSKDFREKSKVLAEKLSEVIHSNSREIINQYIPMLAIMARDSIKQSKENAYIQFEQIYRLEKKDVDALMEMAPI